jgi:hypothetical protein
MSLYPNLEANTFSMDSPLKYESINTKDDIDGKEKDMSNSIPLSAQNIEVSVEKVAVDITSAQRRGSAGPNKASAGYSISLYI